MTTWAVLKVWLTWHLLGPLVFMAGAVLLAVTVGLVVWLQQCLVRRKINRKFGKREF